MIGAERMFPCRKLPGDDAEREQVGAAVDGSATELFGAIPWRSQRDAGLRQTSGGLLARPFDAGEAEIEDLICPSSRRMMFSGFRSRCTIPCWCSAERRRDVDQGRHEPFHRQRPVTEFLPQRASVHQLRHDGRSPSTSSRAKIVAIAGWERAAAARASRVSRLRRVVASEFRRGGP